MDRGKLGPLFGNDVVEALQMWRERGYRVTERMGVITVSNHRAELIIARWDQWAQVKLVRPVQTERLILLIFNCEFYNTSKKTVQAVEELLTIAEGELYRLTSAQRRTYGRVWRDLIQEAEACGFTAFWGKVDAGALSLEREGCVIRVIYVAVAGEWVLSFETSGTSMSGLAYSDDDEEAVRILRQWMRIADVRVIS